MLKTTNHFFIIILLFLILFSKNTIAAVAGDPVPSCTANDYTYDVFNVVPNGVCTNLSDTLNVSFSVLVTGNPARYDLAIGYTEAGNSTLIDVHCLNTNYDINGGGCDDYDKNNSPITATSNLDVSCDVDGNLLVDPFLNVDFFLNWDIDKRHPHNAEITSPKCKSNAGAGNSIPLLPAQITLVKSVTNDNIGTSVATNWTLNANIAGGIAELTGTTGISDSNLVGGEYVLSETSGPSGYSLESISCIHNANSNAAAGTGATYDVITKTLSLAALDKITCTFTNNDIIPPNAAFTISKVLSGEDGLFSGFVEAGETLTYTITINNVGGSTGSLTIDEIVPAGTTFITAGNSFVTASCVNGAAAGTVCSLSSPNIPSLSSTTMSFIVKANSPLTTTSIENFVIEHGTIPPICSATDSSDSRCVSTSAPTPIIKLQKNSITISDPINDTTNPKAIPGALTEYTILATNSGYAATDNNSIIINDTIPANTALYVNDISGSGTGPVRFIDGAPPSGLSYSFVSLASTTDEVSFSNDNGASYNYTPSADTDGSDSTVTNIRMVTQGAFLGNNGSGSPKFQFMFRVRIK